MSLDKLENKVLIHHPHVKRFPLVKKLRKSVKYIGRYSTKYAEPRREHATLFRLAGSPPKLLDRSSPNILPPDAMLSAVYAVVVSVCLSVCVSVTLWYCIKMAERRITQIMPHDSPLTLVFPQSLKWAWLRHVTRFKFWVLHPYLRNGWS